MRPPRVAVAPLCALLALTAPACSGEEPVLQGVPEAPLLTEQGVDGADEATPERPVARRSANPELYERPEEIYIDVNWMGGRSYREARAVVTEQLGALQDTRDLGETKGQELQFERGRLRLAGDQIYFVYVPLPQPTRWGLALYDTGFSSPVTKVLETHRAYRFNNERGFRRIRLTRLDNASEFVTAVEAWKWIPGEHSNRR